MISQELQQQNHLYLCVKVTIFRDFFINNSHIILVSYPKMLEFLFIVFSSYLSVATVYGLCAVATHIL